MNPKPKGKEPFLSHKPVGMIVPMGSVLVADDDITLGELQRLAQWAGMKLAHRCGLVLERVE